MSKKLKTIEDLLEEALVPEEEQPYQVPDNWVWVRMGEPLKINPPKPKLDLPSEELCSFLPMSNVNPVTGKIDILEERTFDKVKKGYTYFEENDVLFAKITPCMENGNTVIAKGLKSGFGYGSTEFYVFRTTDQIDNKYLYYLLRSNMFRNQAKMAMTGAVGQQRVPKKYLENYPLALPPLNEQKRLADKVERLLNKIYEAKQLIDEAKESYELRRASILDKAFRGELTNSVSDIDSIFEIDETQKLTSSDVNEVPYTIPDNWKWCRLEEVTSFTSGYAFKSKEFVDKGLQVIRMGNLYKNKLLLKRNPVFVPFDYDSKVLDKYAVNNGNILLSLTGTKYKRDYGYAVRLEGLDKPLLLNQRIVSLKPHYFDEYIYYYLQSPVFRDQFFSHETGGVNQGNVGVNAVKSVYIPIPPVTEAEKIAGKLKVLLNNEKESLYLLNIEDKINNLINSILSKAFRGELGTNDPIEESAIELLIEVLKEE